jgi:Uma2 family endonuclease
MNGISRPGKVTPDEFYRFVRAQRGGRYELVDGEIVAIAGADRRHDHIAANGIRLLENALAGQTRCSVFTMDTFLRIPGQTNRRQPDFGIECGNPPEDLLEADQPGLIAEVLSETTAVIDVFDKVPEYQTISSVDIILAIDPNLPRARVWRRLAGGSWPPLSEHADGLDATIKIPQWDFAIRLADLYGCLDFTAQSSQPPQRMLSSWGRGGGV